jgi:hypothetical protein
VNARTTILSVLDKPEIDTAYAIRNFEFLRQLLGTADQHVKSAEKGKIRLISIYY